MKAAGRLVQQQHRVILSGVACCCPGDVAVKVDNASTAAVDLVSGTSPQIGLVAGEPVLIAEHQ